MSEGFEYVFGSISVSEEGGIGGWAVYADMVAEGILRIGGTILLGPIDIFPLWGCLCFGEVEVGDAPALSVCFMPHIT